MDFSISSEDPILVVVTEDRWEAFSLKSEATEHDKVLCAVLKSMGGISESVAPGRYHFNAVDMNSETRVVSLEPVQD